MWGLFSSGPKTPKKEVVDKEEYDQILDENKNFVDKVRLLNSEYTENKGRLDVVLKKIEDLEALVSAKQEIVNVLKAGSDSLISSDIKGAEKLKNNLKARIAELQEENKVNKEKIGESYEALYSEIAKGENENSKNIIIEMPKLLIINTIIPLEENKEITPPNPAQIKSKLKEIDNSEDIYVLLKKIPNKLEEYEKSNVFLNVKNIRREA